MNLTAKRRLVEVSVVHAPGFVVPGVKLANGDKACLRDFGAAPFQLVVSIKMLAPHVPGEASGSDGGQAPGGGGVGEAGEGDTEGDQQPDAGVREQQQQPQQQHREAVDELCAELDADASLEDWLPSAQELELMKAAAAAMNAKPSNQANQEPVTSGLDPPPASIQDRFSSVTGDIFHFQDRPKIAMHAEVKKSYFVSLRDAWLVFEADGLEEVKAVLRDKHSFTEDEIESRMYFDFDYFRQRVPRRAPPPSTLYWRVRAVFETYGDIIVQPKAGCKQPFFNAAAWRKANGVLQEILAGHGSDAPGYVPYHHKLDKDGNPKSDEDGCLLLDCNRGTSDTECVHKQLVNTFGSWVAGVKMSAQLLRETRHRFNHRVAERRRLGFPKVGHYDTWLIDQYQMLVELNHGIDIFPGWSNTKDFAPTEETFGVVPLHSEALSVAMQQIKLPEGVVLKLTGDHRCLCEAMGTPLPLLPIHSKDEHALFTRLVLAQLNGDASNKIDFEALAITWCAHVNGATIFPKLPVYLRLHFSKWQRNQRIKDALRNMQPALDDLQTLFHEGVVTKDAGQQCEASEFEQQRPEGGEQPQEEPHASCASPEAPQAAAPQAAAPQAAAPQAAPQAAAAPQAPEPPQAQPQPQTPIVGQHQALPRAPLEMVEARAGMVMQVATMFIADARPMAPPRKRHRGPDKQGTPRRRTCQNCGNTTDCPGRWQKEKCVHGLFGAEEDFSCD